MPKPYLHYYDSAKYGMVLNMAVWNLGRQHKLMKQDYITLFYGILTLLVFPALQQALVN